MNIEKYRKYYLLYNWDINCFDMIKYKLNTTEMRERFLLQRLDETIIISNEWNHPMVNLKKAYWINYSELCIGYKMIDNPTIFRPIFSHSRQRLLDRVNSNILNPYMFWNKLKSRTFIELYKKKYIPLDIIYNIITFIY
tara:strand:- start:1968 stop:2384 length:417 start_codon:yes stop_codon:yes gene_type:complete